MYFPVYIYITVVRQQVFFYTNLQKLEEKFIVYKLHLEFNEIYVYMPKFLFICGIVLLLFYLFYFLLLFYFVYLRQIFEQYIYIYINIYCTILWIYFFACLSEIFNWFYTQKHRFILLWNLSGIWSWWQFSFQFWIKWNSICFRPIIPHA